MTINEALKSGIKILNDNGVSQSARTDCEILLCTALNRDRLFIIINKDRSLTDNEQKLYFELVNQRKTHMPISYITGKKEFMSLDFYVCEEVLIPRPDTEILVEHIIDSFKGRDIKILDLCCGSGAIGISLAYYLKNSYVTLADVNDKCVEITQKNAEVNGVLDRVKIIRANVFEELSEDNGFDVIVSNPPYIRSVDIFKLDKTVKDFEPTIALDGGDDGLIFYRRITELSCKLLKSGGMLAFEVGFDQSSNVAKIMSRSFINIGTKKDLSGIERIVYGNFYENISK